MQEITDGLGIHNLRPGYVARIFAVHKRTVFRWIGRGLLSSRNGLLLDTEVKANLELWEASCPQVVTTKKLHVTHHTVNKWVRRGVLKVVSVLGFERVTLISIGEVAKQKKEGTFSLYPGFIPVSKLLILLGVRHKFLDPLIRAGLVKSLIVDGVAMLSVEEFTAIKEMMDSSMKCADVRRKLKVDKGTIRRWVKKGKLKEVKILGLRRIMTDSLPERVDERLYIQRISQLHNLKVVTARQASKVTGKSEDFICELMSKGILRGERVDDQLYIAASSLKVFLSKSKKVKSGR